VFTFFLTFMLRIMDIQNVLNVLLNFHIKKKNGKNFRNVSRKINETKIFGTVKYYIHYSFTSIIFTFSIKSKILFIDMTHLNLKNFLHTFDIQIILYVKSYFILCKKNKI